MEEKEFVKMMKDLEDLKTIWENSSGKDEKVLTETVDNQIELLEKMVGDTFYLIKWYCFDTNFGEKFSPFCPLDSDYDGSIFVEDASSLYHIIINLKKLKKYNDILCEYEEALTLQEEACGRAYDTVSSYNLIKDCDEDEVEEEMQKRMEDLKFVVHKEGGFIKTQITDNVVMLDQKGTGFPVKMNSIIPDEECSSDI